MLKAYKDIYTVVMTIFISIAEEHSRLITAVLVHLYLCKHMTTISYKVEMHFSAD